MTCSLTRRRGAARFHLEVYLQHQFKDSRIQRRSNRSERRVSKAAVWIPERRSIGDIECLCTEFRSHPFGDREELPNHHVSHAVPWPNDRVPRTVADRELWSLCKCRRVKPPPRCALVGR